MFMAISRVFRMITTLINVRESPMHHRYERTARYKSPCLLTHLVPHAHRWCLHLSLLKTIDFPSYFRLVSAGFRRNMWQHCTYLLCIYCVATVYPLCWVPDVSAGTGGGRRHVFWLTLLAGLAVIAEACVITWPLCAHCHVASQPRREHPLC